MRETSESPGHGEDGHGGALAAAEEEERAWTVLAEIACAGGVQAMRRDLADN